MVPNHPGPPSCAVLAGMLVAARGQPPADAALPAARHPSGALPDVTRRRIYLEQMQAILPALQKKVIVDDSLKNILQTLPLTTPESTPSTR